MDREQKLRAGWFADLSADFEKIVRTLAKTAAARLSIGRPIASPAPGAAAKVAKGKKAGKKAK